MIESGIDVPFLPHTRLRGVEKIHPPRRGRTSGVNEFPLRHVRPTYMYIYICIGFRYSNRAREITRPLPSLYFVLHIRNADGLLFFDPVRNFTTAFLSFSFFNLRSEIPSGYCAPSPSSRIHRVFSRADPFKQGSRQIGEGLVLVK